MNKTKVKIFTGDIDDPGEQYKKELSLENLINNWLETNQNIELIEIQYLNISNFKGTALIVYKGN